MLLKSAKSKFINGEYDSFLNTDAIIDTMFNDSHNLIGEFVFAVIVCSTTYDDFKDDVTSGEFVKVLNELKETVNKQTSTLINSIHEFAHYLHQGTQAPLVQPKPNADNLDNIASPEEAMMATLMGELGYTRDECLNLPLTETLSAYLLYAHKMDAVELIGTDALDAIERLKSGKV
jgi:hypothetical protein